MLARKSKILIVEDDLHTQELLTEFFSMKGYLTEVCNDGLKAIELIRKHPYDTIICDIGLPGADGFQVIAALKSSTVNRKTPIFVASGILDDSRLAKLESLKVAYFVSKPVPLEDLATKLKAVVNPSYKAIGYQKDVLDLVKKSTQDVLEFYFNEQPVAWNPKINADAPKDIAALSIINFYSLNLYGFMTLGCSEPFLKKLAGVILGSEDVPLENLRSIAAEMANQIAGNIKRACASRKISQMIGLPLELHPPFDETPSLMISPKVLLEFNLSFGPACFVEFSFGEPDDLVSTQKPEQFPVFVYEN